MSNYQQSNIRVLCSEIHQHVEETITIKGWVHRLRNLGHLVFLDLRDRSGLIQCVLEDKLTQTPISLESVVMIKGQVVKAPKAPNGYEIKVLLIEAINPALSPLPFEINKSQLNARLDTLLDHRVLSLRHAQVHSIFKIQAILATAFAEFLTKNGFTRIFTPKIVGSGTEGGSNLFAINYFEDQAYLAQSPQFYKQMMVGAGFERVFEIAPVYRAEDHNTSRHLNEYISLDLEMGFIESEVDLMVLETKLLRHMFEKVANECEMELNLHRVEIPVISEIPRMTVREAQGILKRQYGKESPKGDLDPEGERLICQYVAKDKKSALVFLTRYPRDIRPMYTMPAPEDSSLTASFDLLFNGLEITTGGQRIHHYSKLVESIESKGMEPKHFASYLELFYCGMPPHGGLAIGLERLTSRLLGLTNVREASAFPRDRTRLTP